MGTPQFCFRCSLTPERRFHFSIYRVHSRSEDGGGPHFRAERHPAGDAAPEDHGHGQALRRVRRDGRLVKNTRNSLSIGHLQPKEAIKFLLDAKFDSASADFKKIVRCLLNEDERLDENVQKEKRVAFFKEALSLVGKSKRKIEREIEAYEITNSFQPRGLWLVASEALLLRGNLFKPNEFARAIKGEKANKW